jgi:ABC-type branched-subunit amino acid transport system ATPase component
MAEPRLLLVDEPFIGLSPQMREEVGQAIRRINRDGVAILLIEQNVAAALAMSDKAYILREGRVVLTGASAQLAGTDKIQQAFLGRAAPLGAPAADGKMPDPQPR